MHSYNRAVSSASEPSTWGERASRALSDSGRRRGAARRAIVALLEGQACALSASEIQRQLGDQGQDVSRATVYRVMEELEAIGLLQRVELGRGTVRYEPIRRGPGHQLLLKEVAPLVACPWVASEGQAFCECVKARRNPFWREDPAGTGI